MNPSNRFAWAALLMLATLICATGTAGAAEPLSERNRQVIERAFADWTSGKGSFFEDVISPDVVWTIQGSGPAAGVYRGRQEFLHRAVRPFAQRLATPIVPRVQAIWAQGNQVVVRWNGTATARDGAPYRNEYVWIFDMHDDRAVRVEAFLDLAPYQDVIDRIPLAAEQDSRRAG
ncbi:nuclear transport factor 2 family protein [Pseudomonas sp. EpS/L25]|uniref:nuclear transport factor 2 family protein n=1 Tax=Pseudomonas sp. EpS/L25 TaxID=1749078 RepID=UPI0007434C88|nr:nuclear transport factor 2 family protein [Pseudomonas sp. EpS/L25]KUM43321.1 ketosteroid isomerase [Pseudomonas sp. EpS/L25]